MFVTTPRSLSGANHSVSSSAPLSTRPHVLVESDERYGFRQAGMQPRPELAVSREGSPRIEKEPGRKLGSIYSTLSTVMFRPLNCTVSPARAPSMAWKIGAIVEMPISSCP